MATRTVSPSQFGAVFLKEEGARLSAIDRAIMSAATQGARLIRSLVPVDRGALRRSTHVEPGPKGPTIVEDAPYAAAHETGTVPFTPPLGPLLAWAKRQAPNLGLVKDGGRGRDKQGRFTGSVDMRAVYALAVGTQKAIAERGIKATWAARDSLPELVHIMEAAIRRAIGR